jgi:CheY-like chemotaxis protein
MAMPRMDGTALIRALRRLDRQLPIVALAARAEDAGCARTAGPRQAVDGRRRIF